MILVGPATFGTLAAGQAIGGGHALISLLKVFGVNPPNGIQAVLATLSGVYQLLPWDANRLTWLGDHDLKDSAFWHGLADDARLTKFFGWGNSIDTSFFNSRTKVILGDLGNTTPGGLVFDGTRMIPSSSTFTGGDGTVPHSCSVIPNVTTYKLPLGEHATLPGNPLVIGAILDLLADRSVVTLARVSDQPSSYTATGPFGALSRSPTTSPLSGTKRREITPAGIGAAASSKAGDQSFLSMIDAIASQAVRSGVRVRIEFEAEPHDH